MPRVYEERGKFFNLLNIRPYNTNINLIISIKKIQY